MFIFTQSKAGPDGKPLTDDALLGEQRQRC